MTDNVDTLRASVASSKLSDLVFSTPIGSGGSARVQLCRLRVAAVGAGSTPQSKQQSNGASSSGGDDGPFAVKILKKHEVIHKKQLGHAVGERDLLLQLGHPFIVTLYRTFQDEQQVYFLMEYCPTPLYASLRTEGRFPGDVAKFYMAELVLAFEYLHSKDIIYRDLKPENLLLDGTGHLKLVDFGIAKKLKAADEQTFTLCGTPEYLAPEVIQSKGHGKAVDWWAMGILLYEFLVGHPPFFDVSPFLVLEKILEGKLKFPAEVDIAAKDLIKGLLKPNVAARLKTADEVKHHAYFRGTDWSRVLLCQYTPPKLPTAGSTTARGVSSFPSSSSTPTRTLPASRDGRSRPEDDAPPPKLNAEAQSWFSSF